MSIRRIAALLIFVGAVVCAVLIYHIGTVASASAPEKIGPPPADLQATQVIIDSSSGSRLAGWFLQGRQGAGSVLLMHGVRANRLAMVDRARFLHAQGFSVLLFDFQAEGESTGEHITFGHLEAADARSAFDFLRGKTPGERIGVIGTSLGGASAILADPPIEADAMVLEAVYSTFEKTTKNRLASRCGAVCTYFSPLLTWQVRPRLGFDPDALAPVKRISRLHVPLLLMAGEHDEYATLADMQQIYAANMPKELWVVPDAAHVDFHRLATKEYESRVLAFLALNLREQR